MKLDVEGKVNRIYIQNYCILPEVLKMTRDHLHWRLEHAEVQSQYGWLPHKVRCGAKTQDSNVQPTI